MHSEGDIFVFAKILLVYQKLKQLAMPRLTRNRFFWGVMIGLPYLHSIAHPQSN